MIQQYFFGSAMNYRYSFKNQRYSLKHTWIGGDYQWKIYLGYAIMILSHPNLLFKKTLSISKLLGIASFWTKLCSANRMTEKQRNKIPITKITRDIPSMTSIFSVLDVECFTFSVSLTSGLIICAKIRHIVAHMRP